MVWFIVVGVVGLIAGWALNNVNRSFEEFREQEEANRDRKFRESVETLASGICVPYFDKKLTALASALGYEESNWAKGDDGIFKYVDPYYKKIEPKKKVK